MRDRARKIQETDHPPIQNNGACVYAAPSAGDGFRICFRACLRAPSGPLWAAWRRSIASPPIVVRSPTNRDQSLIFAALWLALAL